MRVEQAGEPAAFLDRAGGLLLADEARHNLILGIAGTLRDVPEAEREHRLWLVMTDSGDTVAAALQTPPFNLVLARPARADALAALVDGLDAEGVDLPGVTGAVPEVDAFAAQWRAHTGLEPRVRMRQRVYRALEIRTPRGVTGAPRSASKDDRDLLVSWMGAFAEEALHGLDAPAEQHERAIDLRLEHGAGGFVLWEDGGEVVSLAGWGGRTPNGVRVGPVYTPPDHRRRGYGSAVTAAVSSERLASGRRFCCLYTDLANPTSNRIYVDIGYEPVCDSVEYAFG